MGFEKLFSDLAQQYARHRPTHPPEIFEYLATLPANHELAWDVGTGSGQAALELTKHFDKVIATDASREQIDEGFSHPKVEYRVEPAENTTIPEGMVDLVTAAVSMHWFDLPAFYREVRRVSRPGGVLAAWTYFFPTISPAVDALLRQFYYDTLAGFWSERLRFVEARYSTLPFPFDEIEPPSFQMKARWNLTDLSGFILSWSGTAAFIEKRGERPVAEFLDLLRSAWGKPDQIREVLWDLYFRVGRVEG